MRASAAAEEPGDEPDRVEGAPHPRHTRQLFGQSEAERTFLAASRESRLHHAWLVSGPRGVGKATLVWRLARYLLALDEGERAPSLDIAADHPVARRVSALSEPRLFLMRRTANPQTGRLRDVITIDVARQLRSFLGLSSTDGTHRVVVIDAADEMNVAAANAILKLLEEPPPRVTLFLVSHAPMRLLPTIRSRCRVLRCHPLDAADMARALEAADLDAGADARALAELSGGSAGEAMRLLALGGLDTYAELVDLFSRAPDMDRARLIRLASSVSGSSGDRLDLVLRLADLFLSRLARNGAGHPPAAEAVEGEAACLARLAGDATAGRRWAQAQQQLSERARHGRAVNLDPSALILDMGLAINETAAF